MTRIYRMRWQTNVSLITIGWRKSGIIRGDPEGPLMNRRFRGPRVSLIFWNALFFPTYFFDIYCILKSSVYPCFRINRFRDSGQRQVKASFVIDSVSVGHWSLSLCGVMRQIFVFSPWAWPSRCRVNAHHLDKIPFMLDTLLSLLYTHSFVPVVHCHEMFIILAMASIVFR